MIRSQRPAVAACRQTRRAATILAWQKHAFVTGVPQTSLSTRITFGLRQKGFAGLAVTASVKTPRKRKSGRRHSERLPCGASRLMASTSGFPRSRPAGLTFRIQRRLSSVLSNTSAAPADSPRCWSNSITIPSLDRLPATGCWKPSAGSLARTSTRVESRSRFHCGQRMNWSRNSRPDLGPQSK